jgi:hypothetical protein
MKCGTTSAFHTLSAHPQIVPARTKEPDFFSQHWDEGWSAYEALWPEPVDDESWALEASTSYTKVPALPNAAARIATTAAEYRFIYLMRDPIARIESHRRHQFLRGRGAEVGKHLLAVSRYATQIDEYRRLFPRDSILLLAFEKLSAEPAAVLRQICEFLDIDPEFQFPARNTPFNKSAEDGRGYRLLQRVPVLSTVAKKLPLRWRRAVRNRLSKPPPELPELDDRRRAELHEALAGELARLRDEYGFDTSLWPTAAR